jgi:hypothetical protein
MRSETVKAMLVFAAIGLGLLVADRCTRLRPYLRGGREGFQNPMAMLQRCGVQYEPCVPGLKCMNGFCLAQDVFPVKDKNPLPVVP